MIIKIKKFKDVKLPTRSYSTDVGLDLYLPEKFLIYPGETKTIGIGIGVQVPYGYAGIMVPRSSTSKKGLIVHPPIIDPGYTGEIHLIITNTNSDTTYIFKKEDRVCSLVLYKVANLGIEEVEEFENSSRGEKGLGSSGK